MKISDIIRTVLDLVDAQNNAPAQIKVTAVDAPETHDHTDDAELLRMKQIAGLIGTGDTEYENSPEEKFAPLSAVLASGNDVHQSKHPSDIRADSISMYPNFQARE
jgi:hypothetical protein